MRLSIVIPTYNRGPALGKTLAALAASDVTDLNEVEILVVDDGSPTPAAPLVCEQPTKPPFSLRCIRQQNAGPACARNTGFRATHCDFVLFLDDDILVPPQLLRQHLNAHKARPNSVVFGPCPFVECGRLNALMRYLHTLENKQTTLLLENAFVDCDVVGSGQLSVPRCLFSIDDGVYNDQLATPAAEEYELSERLKRQGIPILSAPWITAWHDHPINVSSLCLQQYKHAMGCAEAAIKFPCTLELQQLRAIIASNGPVTRCDPFLVILKKVAKRLLGSLIIRGALLNVTRGAEVALPVNDLLSKLYKITIGAYFCAGVREGLLKFQN